MPRLVSPTGVTVNVSDDKAVDLKAAGYTSADDKSTTKAPAKKSAASRKQD